MSDHEGMSGEPQHQDGPTHGPNGDFIRTTDTAERDAEAARLRSRGLSYRAIAKQLAIDVHTAHDAVSRALRAIVEEPATEVRTLELQRLDAMYDAVLGVLEREHFTVQHGKVIYIGEDDPKPLMDDAPVLAAVDRLLKIQERRARLLGLDSETKVSVSGGVKYEIVGVPAEEL